jgi:hypothetical protein
MSLSIRNNLITLAFFILVATPAAAMPTGWPSDGPNCGVLAHVPMRDVWLGHFAGGRWVRDPFGAKWIDWRDDHVCFASLGGCQSWQKSMRAAFHRLEGYRTCVRIR